MPITQENRSIAISTPLGQDVLIVNHLSWSEQLGQPFQGLLQLASTDGDINPTDLLKQPVSIQVGKVDETPFYLHGYATQLAQAGLRSGMFEYHLTLAPWFELLRHVGGSQIFQQQSVVDIAKAVIDARGFTAELEDRLTQTYRQRAYCVQYAESDFHFLSRLFEEEGIYYFFEYANDAHTMVLCDDVSAHQAVDSLDSLPYHELDSGSTETCVSNFSRQRHFCTASYVLRDYDFQKPRAEMTVRQNAADTNSEWQWYEFPGRFFETDDGQHYARVLTEAAVARQEKATVNVSTGKISAGDLLTITSHPTDALNQEYLITGRHIQASAGDVGVGSASATASFNGQLHVQPSSIPYRSIRETPRPPMPGPQIATVVGPDGEEIWTDSFGRIKIQFAWDIVGAGDDSSSCWIRVTQPWTGKGWGAASIPRVGEEVIVAFLDGDVDRPIVTGRVFNADRMPPEELASGQAKTVFRTRSTKDGDVDCFHELTFDDTKDAELIYLHSERDFQRVVENNDSLTVGSEKQDSGDQSIEIYNDQNIKVGVGSGSGSQTTEIGQDRSTTIDAGDDTLTIQQGDRTVTAESGSITIEANTSITLKCGESIIQITPSGISIQASQIDITAEAQANIAAPEINATADAALALSGGATTDLTSDGQLTVQGAIVQIN
ncbi:Phage-related baseplate assembly protein [Rubripirellula lacrimiformis]|uniref:Phage-related baseplate assembly protein n=1 Tax=Rubripirellula lacrimiformis TaxID=1930273 RepID=A0A517NA05_9BACT|nr:type VI secretion system tip protein TssI/VgrG [Rubripirellula lacrimiformis]QDT03965.1 Phage-related baseplate assembly protein [Rubripirellula lacrimiformis]